MAFNIRVRWYYDDNGYTVKENYPTDLITISIHEVCLEALRLFGVFRKCMRFASTIL